MLPFFPSQTIHIGLGEMYIGYNIEYDGEFSDRKEAEKFCG